MDTSKSCKNCLYFNFWYDGNGNAVGKCMIPDLSPLPSWAERNKNNNVVRENDGKNCKRHKDKYYNVT